MTKNAGKRTDKYKESVNSVKSTKKKRNTFNTESLRHDNKLFQELKTKQQMFDNHSLSAIRTGGVCFIDFYPQIRFHLAELQKRPSCSALLTM